MRPDRLKTTFSQVRNVVFCQLARIAETAYLTCTYCICGLGFPALSARL